MHREWLLAFCAAALLSLVSVVHTQSSQLAAEDRQVGLPIARHAWQGRHLLHGGLDHDAGEEHEAQDEVPAGGRSYTWLKWVAGAVLFVEGLLGVLVPGLLRTTVHATWLLSLINCFAAAVFFSFAVLHLMPDALGAQASIGLDRFPLAAFLTALAFFVVFFLHRVLAPALRLKTACQSHSPFVAAASNAPACPRCGDDCGCAGGVGAGNCGQGCQAGSCQCPQRSVLAKDFGPDKIVTFPGHTPAFRQLADDCGCAGGVGAGNCGQGCQAGSCQCVQRNGVVKDYDSEKAAPGFGLASSSMAAAVAPAVTQPCSPAGHSWKARTLAVIPPVIIMGGVLCHTVLEGLVIGIQRSYADVVTALVAMVSHKWVESIAVATVFMAAGSGLGAIIGFLVPFSLGPLVGIAIGVSVDKDNDWATLVLFALVSGLFIYVGTMGIIAEEFSRFHDPAFAVTRPRAAGFYMFAAMFAGFVVVALLQLVPEAD